MSERVPIPEINSPFPVWRWLRLTLALLILVGLISATFPFVSLDEKLGDLYFRLRGARPTSTSVALVLIDDDALTRHGRWPWHRHDLAQLVRVIASFHPKALGVDILLSEPEDAENDGDLTSAIASARNVVLASKISDSPAGNLWTEPLPVFSGNAAAVGHVQATLDADGVCRRIPIVEPSLEGARVAFAYNLAELANPDLRRTESGKESREAVGSEGAVDRVLLRSLTINYRQQLALGQTTAPFFALSASDLLEGKDGSQLKDKVVLLGFGAADLSDRLFTPVSNQLPMPGVEVNANAVDTLLSRAEVKEIGVTFQVLLCAGLSILFLWMVVRQPRLKGLLLVAGTLLAMFFAAYFLFIRAHLLFHYAPLLMTGVIAAPLAQLENLIIVERAITRRLRDIRQLLGQSRSNFALTSRLDSSGGAGGSPLHWKLNTLSSLQDELASLYVLDETLLATMEEPLAVFTSAGRLIFHNASWRKFCEKQDIDVGLHLRAFADVTGGWQELEHPAAAQNQWLEKEASFRQGVWRIRATQLPQISRTEPHALMLLLEDMSASRERDMARAEALNFVTHELRTPLISIQGFAEFLTRYPEKSATSEAPATIFRESKRLVAMINAYLEVLRLDAGARPLKLKPVDIVDVVKHVENILQPLAQAARIGLRVEHQLEVSFVQCDEPLLSGALLNLLSNAVKYSPPGSEVVLKTLSNQDSIEFGVQNPGPAIPADALDRLFEPFYRVAQQAEMKPGWGLGLAFVKRIALQHGGRVEVSSGAASGTCFRLVLPIGSQVGSEVLT